MKKRTMTLNLSADEMSALEQMAEAADMSKTAVIRQALRLRHLIRAREETGFELAWRDRRTGSVTTMMLELPKMDFAASMRARDAARKGKG